MPLGRLSASRAPTGTRPLFCQLLKEADDALNSRIEIRDVEFFVGRVQVVVGQAEAHHDAGDLERLFEVGDDGDGAAAADVDRVFAEDVAHGGGGGLHIFIVGRDDDGVGGAPELDVDINPFGRD